MSAWDRTLQRRNGYAVQGGAKRQVLKVYPKAHCLKAVRSNGYFVYDCLQRQIGIGTNPRHAWEKAAANLFAEVLTA